MATEREVLNMMTWAARDAVEVAVRAGYDRNSPEARRSAFAAADEVHRRERPEDYQAAPITLPDVPPDDPIKARMDRDVSRETSSWGDADDDVPFRCAAT